MYTFHKDGLLPDAGQVFVFGSNEAGRHGAGAALAAKQRFGAEIGKGSGYMWGEKGHCYAIPTKDRNIKTLSLESIEVYVAQFRRFALAHPEMDFFVTRVGCGLAGYTDADIAPLFKGLPPNIIFPEQWAKWVQ